MRNSVLEELRVRRLADIEEEISCRAVWRWEILESKLLTRVEGYLRVWTRDNNVEPD